MPFPPIGLFAAVMGLVGLGLAARAAAPLFPGLFRAPAYFTEPWIAAGILAFAVLAVAYALKILAGKAKADFTEPERIGFLGTIPVGLMLIAAGLAPYLPRAADAIWWTSLVLHACCLIYGLARLVRLGLRTQRITPAWIVLLVGGIVLPAGGIPLGHAGISTFAFCVSLVAGLLLVVPLATRGPLPAPLRPGWFILLAPPALISVHGNALFHHPAFAAALYVAFGVLAVLLYYARDLWRWPVHESVWSLTFPLDALALAAARQALLEQSEAWRAAAALALVLALLAVVFSLYRTFVRRADARVQ